MKEETIFESTTQTNVNSNKKCEEITVLDAEETRFAEETQMSEETGNAASKGSNNKGNSSWVGVTLGGVSGIFLGAGLMHGYNAYAQKQVEDQDPINAAPINAAPINADPSPTDPQPVNPKPESQVAVPSEDLSFGEAFAQARALAGPDGVFVWHGGVYSCHTAEEWNAMSYQHQEQTVARAVTTPASQVTPPTDGHTHVAPVDDSIHIVGVGEYEGHVASAIDLDNDNEADIAIIDMDDNMQLSGNDVIINGDGDVVTVNQASEAGVHFAGNPYSGDNGNLSVRIDDNPIEDDGDSENDAYLASLVNPDVAPDMPDYMDDAQIDA